jgi:hypothetical protein
VFRLFSVQGPRGNRNRSLARPFPFPEKPGTGAETASASFSVPFREHRFFHWEIAFPEIFTPGTAVREDSTWVIGNPPWERIKLQETGVVRRAGPGHSRSPERRPRAR